MKKTHTFMLKLSAHEFERLAQFVEDMHRESERDVERWESRHGTTVRDGSAFRRKMYADRATWTSIDAACAKLQYPGDTE